MPDHRHPLVGSWLTGFPDEPDAKHGLIACTADGVALQASTARPAIGAWAATGERSANLTLVLNMQADAAAPRMVWVRAELELDEVGDRFSGRFTMEAIAMDDSSSGQRGPLAITGERIRAEGPSLRD